MTGDRRTMHKLACNFLKNQRILMQFSLLD